MSTDYKKAYKEKGVTAGVAEIQGHRSTQEDRVELAVVKIEKFPNLSIADQEKTLRETFAEIQQTCGDHGSQGSTGCVTTAWLDDSGKVVASTGNLGDSTSFLIVIDEKTNTVASTKLLNNLHSPDPNKNPNEYARVMELARKNGNRPFKEGLWRLGSGLAMSRSIGDKESLEAGLLHEPEITHTEFKLLEGQKAYIVVACDGLTEENDDNKPALTLTDIGNIVNEGRKHGLNFKDIADKLIRTAFNNGSEDNISAAVYPVTKTPTSAVVFDGHGGDKVSNAAANCFYRCLEKKILLKVSNSLDDVSKNPQKIKLATDFLQVLEAQQDQLMTKTNKSDKQSQNKKDKIDILNNTVEAVAEYLRKPNDKGSFENMLQKIIALHQSSAKIVHVGLRNKIFQSPSTTTKKLDEFIMQAGKFADKSLLSNQVRLSV
jgi:serine/threonine protein phosphatase PrpC